MPSRFFKDQPKRDFPSQAETRRAKEFYEGVFVDSIIAQIDESSASRGRGSSGDIVAFAADIADAALVEMEKRWPKI